ncbi:MAG TPA: hypothetical protein VFK78_07470 [Gemmatimonadales bacterium]|nr:hypothetical protein [Gemmatimonadales bacterium]
MRRSAWLLLSVFFLPAVAHSQDVASLCRSFAHPELSVGRWASYATTRRGRSDSVRIAIIGSERDHDTTFYWFEFSSHERNGDAVVFQILMPAAYDVGHARAAVMKSGTEQAIKIPMQMFRMTAGRTFKDPREDFVHRCARAHLVGWESVTVPAGTFRAAHLLVTDSLDHGHKGDVWATPDVGIGLVKMVEDDGTTMILTGRGTGAKSGITEQPREMGFPSH